MLRPVVYDLTDPAMLKPPAYLPLTELDQLIFDATVPADHYLRRVLGEKATQNEIDEKVLAVRKLPWSEIVRE